MPMKYAVQIDNKGRAGGVLAPLLLCLFFILSPVASHALKVPNCQKTYEDLLGQVGDIPAIGDLQNTLELAGTIGGMATGDIEANLDNIGQMLDDIAPDQVINQMQNIGNKLQNPDMEAVGVLGGSINDLLTGSGLSNFDAQLRKAYEKFSGQYAQETDPAKKNKLYDRMQKISDMISTWPDMGVAAQQSNQQLSEKLENTGIMDSINGANDILGMALDPASMGSDMSGVLGQLGGLDTDKLGNIKGRIDEICGLFTGGSVGDLVKNVLDAYAGGFIDAAKDKLKQVMEDTLTKLKDKLTGAAKEKAQQALGKLKSGDLEGAKGLVEEGGLDGLLDGLGGVAGALGGSLTGMLGGVTGAGAGGITGGEAGSGISSGGETGSSVGSVAGVVSDTLSCFLPKPKEKIACPMVECDPNIGLKGANSGSKRFIERVEAYFKYEPKKNNRSLYSDKEHLDFEINKIGELTRPPGSSMANVADVSSGGGIEGLLDNLEDQIMNKLQQMIRDLINKGVTAIKGKVNQVLAQHGKHLPDEKLEALKGEIANGIEQVAKETPAGDKISQSDIDRVLDKGEAKLRDLLAEEGITLPQTDINSIRSTMNSEVNKAANQITEKIMKEVDGVMAEAREEVSGLLANLQEKVIPQDKIDQAKANIKNKLSGALANAGVSLSGDQLDGLLGGVGNLIGGFFGGVRDGCTEILPGITGLFDDANSGPVSEPCQDNRWRDVCLMGETKPDSSYLLAQRKLKTNEEPFAGVAGSSPLYDKNSNQLWCVLPKNTERVSPLKWSWRYRHQCPGTDKLARQQKNRLEEKHDLLRGDFACLNPLPKCNIQNDWKGDGIEWRNKEYGTYVSQLNQVMGGGINAAIGSVGNALGNVPLLGDLLGGLSGSQSQALQKLMDPQQSTAPECKPAYWVRLMLDSCANQYILNNARKAGSFNQDGRESGVSPRYCQPFRIKPVAGGEEEYNVADYLHRAYQGLLVNDYMPYIEYDRHKGNFAQEGKQHREQNWPERKITWPADIKAKFEQDKQKIPNYLSINDYTGQPVERILDPSHPFSPRNDIATTVDGLKLTDRNMFVEATESRARPAVAAKALGLKKYLCVPKEKKGYFEFGCSIYCSSVPVDSLSYRHKQFSVCMSCQIKTNEKAFWDEYETNRKYYKKEYCDSVSKHDDCEYGYKDDKEICTACFLRNKHSALAATYTTSCVVSMGAAGCSEAIDHGEKALKYTGLCEACKSGAKAEALARTRNRDNEKKEPKWGPTAVGKNWPVCSTRFDHKGDPGLCKKAKQEYGCDWSAKQAENDPNVAEKATDTAKQCEKMDYDEICHDAAKPIYSVNFLKIRTRKGDVQTADEKPSLTNSASGIAGVVSGVSSAVSGNASVRDMVGTVGNAAGVVSGVAGKNFKDLVDELRRNYADEDPAIGYGFREYFGNHRPYMEWHDTRKEAFQVKDKPDYWCDWGSNDAIMGVGRDYNSIHGRKAQLCRYGGGGGIGDSCFTMDKWQDGSASSDGTAFPGLAGSEWAELKRYQANCSREQGLNCLCQFEKIFKTDHPEEKALHALGMQIPLTLKDPDGKYRSVSVEWPLSWRGYISTPANRDNAKTNPAMGNNQQFPYAYVQPKQGSIFVGSLDDVKVKDVVIWTPESGDFPMVATVTKTLGMDFRRIQVTDANNGKYPDACGTTDRAGRGHARYIYPSKSDMPVWVQDALDEQIVSTASCENPRLGHCVEEDWNKMIIYRVNADETREVM